MLGLVKLERQTLPWPLLLVVVAVALAIGYAIGSASPPRTPSYDDFDDWNGSKAQAEDAMRRWAHKGIGGNRTPQQMLAEVHAGYRPRLMAYPSKNCIQLEPDGVGGAPIYCYRANSLDLLEEYSNVE
jgi:hypothetical protein